MNSNPWSRVSLADYEAHMAMPGVGQAAMLAQEFRRAVERTRPNSLALVGCAGGNGLAELAEYDLDRVVCVDVNPTYLQTLKARYEAKIRNLECHCCELEQFRNQEPVDLVFAGLIFEYTQLDEALDSVSRLLHDGGSLYALVQMPADGMATVTPSRYAKSLGVVEETFKYIAPRTLINLAVQRNLTDVEQRVIALESGKSFTLVQFQKSRMPSCLRNPQDMNISPATIEDAAAIFDLQRLAYQTEAAIYDDFSIPPLVETLDQLREQFRSRWFLKAIEDGRIVGSVRAFQKDATCYVERLIVDPEHRNRGIGTALLRQIEAAYPAAARFELFTGHKSVNNLRLYERLGYRPLRRQPVNKKLTMVYLEKVVAAKMRGDVEPAACLKCPNA